MGTNALAYFVALSLTKLNVLFDRHIEFAITPLCDVYQNSETLWLEFFYDGNGIKEKIIIFTSQTKYQYVPPTQFLF
jgi:hypothetical protein